MNATHLEDDVRSLEEDVLRFRSRLLAGNPAMSGAELQQEVGRYTARRKVELGLFTSLDG